MTRHDKLKENYEDALFALMLDEIAEEEGKQLLEENERLKRNPGAAVPYEVDKRCLKTIKKMFAKTQRRDTAHAVYRILNKVALVALIVGAIFSTAYAAFPEVRIKTLNLLIEVSDVATSLRLDENSSNMPAIDNNETLSVDGQSFRGYNIPEVPEGFEVVNQVNDGPFAWVDYTREGGAEIHLSVTSSIGATLNVDTENADNVEDIQIHGYDGLLIEKDENVHIVWGDTDEENFISVICSGLDKSIALDMAYEIYYLGNE